jgi:hypothetical protein
MIDLDHTAIPMSILDGDFFSSLLIGGSAAIAD